MADWLRRSPQIALDCPNNPNNPGCAKGGSTTIAATESSEATKLPQETEGATGTAANEAVVVTTTSSSIGTNDAGGLYTKLYTLTMTESQRTTALPTAPVETTQLATITDPPEAQSASQGSSNRGVSNGAVAGIAIGTCIFGAVIAFIAAWLLYKRRDKKFMEKTCPSGYPIYADSSPELVMIQKSAAHGSPYVQVSQTQMRTPVPVPARVPVASPQSVNDALMGILPPEASEHDVRTRITALFAEVRRHVDTYYRDVHASMTPSMDSDLASFGKDVDMLELLQNCAHPTIALKHALVTFVLTITGPEQDAGAQALWPSELSRFIRSQDSGKPSVMGTM